MKRRDFLKGLAAAPSVACWPREVLAQCVSVSECKRPTRIIDVHCHVFNASDLPVENFIENVLLPGLIDEYRDKPDVNWKDKQLITMYDKSKNVVPVLSRVLSQLMIQSSRDIQNETQIVGSPGYKDFLTPRELSDACADREEKILKNILKKLWDPPLLSGGGFNFLQKTVYFDGLREVRAQIRREAIEGDEYIDNEDVSETETYAHNLYYDLGPAAIPKQIGFMMRWALRLGRYRHQLISELANMHGAGLKLMTPAFVDFDMWLGAPKWDDEFKQRKLQIDQINLMAKIARRPNGPRAHGFIGFDPLRQALYDNPVGGRKSSGESPMQIVEYAINNGFLGVKLYPPMGFRPFGNSSVDNFPSYVLDQKIGLGRSAGAAIDRALDKLFVWCQAHNVPIMAHCNDSNGSQRNYGARGSPANWKKLFLSYGGASKNLRVNLAHFGGFEEFFTNPIGQEGDVKQTWEGLILDMWKTMPDVPLYADISYFDELLPVVFGPKENEQKKKYEYVRKTVKGLWKDYVVSAPNADRRLMFGSDWIMVGEASGFPAYVPSGSQPTKFYVDRVSDFLCEVGFCAAQIDQIMFKNAVEFLGLNSKDAGSSRGRLNNFYKDTSSWLNVFD